MSEIGFIGLGIMGRPMAKNLLKAGFELILFDVAPEAAAALAGPRRAAQRQSGRSAQRRRGEPIGSTSSTQPIPTI